MQYDLGYLFCKHSFYLGTPVDLWNNANKLIQFIVKIKHQICVHNDLYFVLGNFPRNKTLFPHGSHKDINTSLFYWWLIIDQSESSFGLSRVGVNHLNSNSPHLLYLVSVGSLNKWLTPTPDRLNLKSDLSTSNPLVIRLWAMSDLDKKKY